LKGGLLFEFPLAGWTSIRERGVASPVIYLVYLVRLISMWYCNWFMLLMTLDMPDEGTR
jgi:hypothetical protein